MKIIRYCSFLFAILITSCSEHTETSEEESQYSKQAVVYAEIYRSGNAELALKAMVDAVSLTKNASESDISASWKNQSIAFSETRISFILEYLGRPKEAEHRLDSAVQHINIWLTETGREKIDRSRLIQNVLAADQAHASLPWHPKIE